MTDKPTFWVLFFQFIKILNGLISVFLVPLVLTLDKQGLWFVLISFGNIILLYSASQNGIVLIFGAHEFKSLSIKDFVITGEEKKRDELYSFIKYSKKFFLITLSLLCFFVCLFFIFYVKKQPSDDIILVFFLYTCGSFFYAINFSFASYVESFNEVQTAYKLKSFYLSYVLLLCVVLLFCDFDLYALSLAYLLPMFCIFIYNIIRHKNEFMKIYMTKTPINKFKKRVFLNYFTKNSFSMVSGFLLFQVYTPLVYYFKGSEVAAKVGLSISIFLALFAVSTGILQAKIPQVLNFIAQKNYRLSYEIYISTFKKSVIFFLFFMFLGTFLLYYVDAFDLYKQRVVNIDSFMLLSCAWFFQLMVYGMVTYTRLFKRELFISQTIISTIYILLTTTVVLKFYSDDSIFMGFLTSYVFGIPWIYIVYRHFMKQKGIL